MFSECNSKQDVEYNLRKYIRKNTFIRDAIIVVLIILAFLLQKVPYGFCVVLLIPFVYVDSVIRCTVAKTFAYKIKTRLPRKHIILKIDGIPIVTGLVLLDIVYFFDDFDTIDNTCKDLHVVNNCQCKLRFGFNIYGILTDIYIVTDDSRVLESYLRTNNFTFEINSNTIHIHI